MTDYNIPWTPAQDKVIARLWYSDPDTCLARLEDRTKAAIQRRACHLGVTRKVQSSHMPWQPFENRVIETDYSTGGSHACAKRLPTRTVKAIKLRAARLGVRYAGPPRRSPVHMLVLRTRTHRAVQHGHVLGLAPYTRRLRSAFGCATRPGTALEKKWASTMARPFSMRCGTEILAKFYIEKQKRTASMRPRQQPS